MNLFRKSVYLCAFLGFASCGVAETDQEAPKPALIEKYKNLLEKQPAEGTALDRLWEIYSKHFTTRELVDEYRKRAESETANPNLWIVLGLLEKRGGQLDGAVTDLKKA